MEGNYSSQNQINQKVSEDEDEDDDEDDEEEQPKTIKPILFEKEDFSPSTEILFVYEIVRHGARAPLNSVPINGNGGLLSKMSDKQKRKEEKAKRKAW